MSVDLQKSDHYRIDIDNETSVSLKSITITRRGPSEKTIAIMPKEQWNRVDDRSLDVLMGQEEKKNEIAIKNKSVLLTLMPGREMAVLFWALIEDEKQEVQEAIFLSWRELAREERWWLYGKCMMPGQEKGMGWRRALLYALSDYREPPKMDHNDKLNGKNSIIYEKPQILKQQELF